MSLSEQIEELEDRIEELEDENSDLDSEVDTLLDDKERLQYEVNELQRKIEELESQVGKEKDYSIVEDYEDTYHTCLTDPEGKFILCIDNIDELEDSNDVESGIRLYNTDLYEWTGVIDSSAQYQFVLKRK